jgi:CRISPR-associated protein Csx10
MPALTLKIELLAPLLLTNPRSGDPNSATGVNYIPGAILRGALIERYLQDKSPGYDLSADATAHRLFFAGEVCYLNAYPCINTGQRMLPVPFSWFTEKDRDETIYEFAWSDHEKLDNPQRVSQPFFYPLDKRVNLSNPKRQVNIHTYRSQRSGINKGIDSVFRYDALAAGQAFAALVWADDAADLEQVSRLLIPPDFSIGRSHRSGYGRVRMHITQTDDTLMESELFDDNEPEQIMVTCLSDLLIRDDTTGAYANDLSSVVGKEAKAAFTRLKIIGGFNRTWGLPLPQAQAIEAGSVFVYDYEATLLAQLRTLVRTGIGERRVEGFGRIAINLQREDKLIKKDDTPVKASTPSPLQGESAALARRMSERILRNGLDQALAKTLGDYHYSVDVSPISNAQLSRLRLVVRQTMGREKLRSEDLQQIRQHLDNLKKPGRKQFEKARVDNHSMLLWLHDLLTTPQNVWSKLNVLNKKGPSIGNQQAELTDPLACEYTLRLINSLLHQAAKTRRSS